MSHRRLLTVLLVCLMGLATVWRLVSGSGPSASTVWLVFLYAIPLALLAGLQTGLRWIAPACVMYATVGLALDISTAVQDLTHQDTDPARLAVSALSGVVNFLVIVVGGREFLEAGLLAPPAPRPPNPPPPQAG